MQRLPTAYELRYRRSVRSQVAELRPLSVYKRYARRLASARADLAEGAWEVVAVLLVLYDAIWTPYLAFMGVREDALLALSLGVDGFFLVDLLVHARLRHARRASKQGGESRQDNLYLWFGAARGIPCR